MSRSLVSVDPCPPIGLTRSTSSLGPEDRLFISVQSSCLIASQHHLSQSLPGWVPRLGTGSEYVEDGWETEGNQGCFTATKDILCGHFSLRHFLRSFLLPCCGGQVSSLLASALIHPFNKYTTSPRGALVQARSEAYTEQ